MVEQPTPGGCGLALQAEVVFDVEGVTATPPGSNCADDGTAEPKKTKVATTNNGLVTRTEILWHCEQHRAITWRHRLRGGIESRLAKRDRKNDRSMRYNYIVAKVTGSGRQVARRGLPQF